MKKNLFTLCFLSTCAIVGACQKGAEEQIPSSDNYPRLISKSDLRGGSGANPYRFLGKGFNLVSHAGYDMEGITFASILDQKRIDSFTPWDPFGNDLGYQNRIPPEANIINYSSTEGWSMGWLEDISDIKTTSDFSVHVGANFKKLSLTLDRNSSIQSNEKLHSFRSYRFKTEARVGFDAKNAQDYTPFLSRRFVESLKNLEASELVAMYGTHLITSYKLGPFFDLTVSTRKVFFSKDETKALASNLIVSDSVQPIFSRTLKDKAEKFAQHTAIQLRQGGSMYTPHASLLHFTGDFSPATIVPFNEGDWFKQVKLGDNNFMEISPEPDLLIAIPSIITDIPLKVKYISGIIDRLRESRTKGQVPSSTNYMLCSPTSFEPIKYNGEYVYVALPRFRNDIGREVTLGAELHNPITNHLGVSGLESFWNMSLNREGLWTITQTNKDGVKYYLCNDFKVRPENKVSADQTLWLFNPIITKQGETGFGTYNLLIQKSK